MLGCRVLIIDDDKDDIDVLSEVFTQCGVDGVHYVFTAMQAFMYLQELKHDGFPKLIVTDLYLPGISGEEFLADLKRMDKYKHIHVIVISSVRTAEEIRRYKDMGADDYLLKPSSYEEYMKIAADIKRKLEL